MPPDHAARTSIWNLCGTRPTLRLPLNHLLPEIATEIHNAAKRARAITRQDRKRKIEETNTTTKQARRTRAATTNLAKVTQTSSTKRKRKLPYTCSGDFCVITRSEHTRATVKHKDRICQSCSALNRNAAHTTEMEKILAQQLDMNNAASLLKPITQLIQQSSSAVVKTTDLLEALR